MPNAAISTLANEISTVTLDATQINNYQDEIYFELARNMRGDVLVQTDATFVAGTKGTSIFALPTANFARTALMIFFDTKQLAHCSYDEARFFDPNWRDNARTPSAVLVDTIDRTNFAAVPPPDRDGQAIGVNTPLVVQTWPADNFVVIYAKSDLTYPGTNYVDTHMAVAFDVIARELGRDSDHTDPDAAIAAKQMSDVFWRLSFPAESL
jgi:hypothetical protein